MCRRLPEIIGYISRAVVVLSPFNDVAAPHLSTNNEHACIGEYIAVARGLLLECGIVTLISLRYFRLLYILV